MSSDQKLHKLYVSFCVQFTRALRVPINVHDVNQFKRNSKYPHRIQTHMNVYTLVCRMQHPIMLNSIAKCTNNGHFVVNAGFSLLLLKVHVVVPFLSSIPFPGSIKLLLNANELALSLSWALFYCQTWLYSVGPQTWSLTLLHIW